MRLKAVLVCLASGGVAAVVACGDDGGAHKLPDAPLGTDGAIPDTPDPPQSARITITRNGSAVEGVDVYFQNADSSLVAKVPTDANGVASAVVMPGAFVTAVNPFNNVATGVATTELKTIAGVQPGDHLRLDQDFRGKPTTFMNVIVDADPDPNASSYDLWSTCLPLFTKGGAPFGMGIGSGSLDRPQVNLELQCTTTADVLIESNNGSGSGVDWVFVDNAPLTPDGTLDITTAYTASTQVNAAFNDIPANITSLSGNSLVATTDGLLWSEGNELGIGSASATWSFPRPQPAGSTQIWDMSMFGGGSYGEQQVIDWKAIADAPTFSYANTLLKDFVGDPTFDIATHTITWLEGSTGVAADVAIAELSASRDTSSFLAWHWQLAGVPSGGSLAFPVLPAEIAQFNPVTDDSLPIFNLTTAKVPGGYNTVRPVVLSIENPVGLVAGAAGRIVLQRYVARVLRAAQRLLPTGEAVRSGDGSGRSTSRWRVRPAR